MHAIGRVGFTVIALILAGCALSAPAVHRAVLHHPATTVATDFRSEALAETSRRGASAPADSGGNEIERWEASGSPDFYGNEVTDAVAKYTLDESGSLYEVHSPQTELPRLTPPKG